MAGYKTSGPVRRAFVQAVRDAPPYTTAVGDFGPLTGVFNAFAPEKTSYPFATYNEVAAPYEDAWGSRMIIAAFDLFVFSRNEAEAGDLDQALTDALDGADLTVEGMDTLICRRISDIPMPPDLDEEGKKVYQIGGSYEIWTDQQQT